MYQAIEVLGAIEHQVRTAHAAEKAAQAAGISELLAERATRAQVKRRRAPLFIRWQVAA